MKSLVVKSKDGSTVAFGIEINSKKTFEEFYAHEKHWHKHFSREAMKEFHDLIRKAADVKEEKKVDVVPPKPAATAPVTPAPKFEPKAEVKVDKGSASSTINPEKKDTGKQ